MTMKKYGILVVFLYNISVLTFVASGLSETESSPGTTGSRQFRLLHVIDPNGFRCFEEVSIDEFTSENLLAWVRELRDELTRTENNPAGQYLKVGKPVRSDLCNR